MASQGRGGRRKGANYERRITKRLRQVWAEAKRGIGQARSGGEVCDVEGTPWWIECKHRDRANPRAAYRQGTEATDGRPVAVIWRRTGMRADLVTVRLSSIAVPETRTDPLVTMPLDVWLEMQGESWGL